MSIATDPGAAADAPRRRYARTALLAFLASFALSSALLAQSSEEDFFLGVQTHFVQGWRLEFMDLVPRLGAASIRDELSWPQVTRARGRYDFSANRSRYLGIAIARGLDPLLLFTDTHPQHDNGQTPYTPEAQTALAEYIAATLDAFAPGLRRIEIGNEFNSDDFVSGPFAEDRPRHFASMLRIVHDTVKARHPDTEILCTGMHSVAIGFFRELFEQGILDSCDAISLHVYRDYPEGLDLEIARLRAVMAEFGTVLPIYVTEFGQWFDDPVQAPDFMLKSVAEMGAIGIAGAWWYALLDQPFWPNMGLYRPDPTEAMPAADSFRLLQGQLLPLGRPRHIGQTREDRIFAFGDPARAVVAWGAQGRLQVSGAERFVDARGQELGPVAALSDTPIVILGDDLEVTIHRDHQVFDTKYGFGMPPWTYLSQRANGTVTPLNYIDWEWSSFLGDPGLRPLLASHGWISGARFATGDYHAIERFTAQDSGAHVITGEWFAPAGAHDTGATIIIERDGAKIASGSAGPDPMSFGPWSVQLEAGDQIDFRVGPGASAIDHAIRRRITIEAPVRD